MKKRTIHAGILLKAGTVEVVFGEVRLPRRGEAPAPLNLYPLNDLPSYEVFSIDEQTPACAQERLSEAVSFIVRHCAAPAGIAVASYGPIESTAIEARGGPLYGVIWRGARHVSLQGLRVYEIVRRLAPMDCEVRVHSDVTAGAIAESLDRAVDVFQTGHERITAGEVVFLGHIAEGVGGSFATGGRPWLGTMHSEVGSSAAQLVWGDHYGWNLFAERVGFPVYLEHLIDTEAIVERCGVERISDIGLDHQVWGIIASYAAQMAQLATVCISPARVVLHGPVFDAHPGLIDMVREDFLNWLQGPRSRPVFYKQLQNVNVFIDLPLSAKPMLRGALMLSALPVEALTRPSPLV